ncbi:TIR domain-containing protein [Paenibacillus sp. FSL R5-0475]|uniref:SLOG domain-containing protein n=1 Tax=Paenibacillus sp. FSL R5-0475 TaxID=2921643 RepID=UPI0030F9E3D0
MRVYIIKPVLTLGSDEQAHKFYGFCLDELNRHAETRVIQNDMNLIQSTGQPTERDIVIFFNRADNNYSAVFDKFLSEGVHSGVKFYPVSISSVHRVPPRCIPDPQSYDVKEAIERRNLTNSQLETIAIAVARDAISILQPTLTRRNMSLFLSHRRSDGEEVAGGFYDALCLRAQNRFRDLSDILVGDKAQDVIENNLRKSDAVIFLDTPQSGDSEWIELELKMALSMNLPIVWVKLGEESGRVNLRVKPAESPHFWLKFIDLSLREMDQNLVDSVIHKAFEISREKSMSIFGHLQRMRELDREGKISLELINEQSYMYEVKIPRNGFRYIQRPMTHLISFYGRIPRDDDRFSFNHSIIEQGYSKHPRLGHVYDAAIMLAPMASQNNQDLIEEPHFIDSCDEYISSLEIYSRGRLLLSQKKGLIISGAFPDCEPEYQQLLWSALCAFIQTILDRNGNVIFGAHPTFQQVIFDIAKLRRPNDYIQAIHMFISKYFVTQATIDEVSSHAVVTGTENVENDRGKSLSTMRKAMINHETAVCMIVLGGKTRRPGLSPGIDEEIELAKAAGLPVFLVGSVGGRSAEIAAEFQDTAWQNKLNPMSIEFNQELMVSPNYATLANKLLDALGI